MRTMVVIMSMEPVTTEVSGSAIFANRPGSVARVKLAGSKSSVTSFHLSGQDAGAPGKGRTEYGATMVRPWPFWPKST